MRNNMFNILKFDCIPSSNDYLLDRIHILPVNTVIHALSQTAGKGSKNDRVWFSPKGNLYFSLYQLVPYTQRQIQYLAVNVAVKIAEVLLENSVVNIAIKWPNDLILNKKKLGGILIETRHNTQSGLTDVVIGVGLNIAEMPADLPITQAYTSLANEGYIFDAELLLQQLLPKIATAYEYCV